MLEITWIFLRKTCVKLAHYFNVQRVSLTSGPCIDAGRLPPRWGDLRPPQQAGLTLASIPPNDQGHP